MSSILVVDDERSIRNTVKAFLENEDHQVETAEEVRTALDILGRQPIDVVLTDIIMPRMTGIDLLKKIRETAPDTLVIMMTGEPTLETAAESVRYGAIDYLQKPVGKAEILKTVRNALHIKSLNDDKQKLEQENKNHLNHLEQLVAERTRALTESEATLRRRADELAILNHLARGLGANVTVKTTVEFGLREIARAVSSDLVLLFLGNEDDLDQKGIYFEGEHKQWDEGAAHRIGECLCGLAFEEDRSIYSLDIHADTRCTRRECKMSGFVSFAALPLKSGEEKLGVLGLATSASRDFATQGSFLEALANELSVGLKKSLLYEQLQEHALELQANIEQTKASEAERMRLMTQLQQAQKMEAIGTLAGGIAHDFNNILSAVLGFTELSLSRSPEDETLRQYLEQVLGAGMRARDLVQQILTFSRQCELAVSPIHISPIVKETLKLIRASLPATIDIRQNIRSELLIMADPTNIHQILMNLCTNAGHAMRRDGGILEISLGDVALDSEFTDNHTGLVAGSHVWLGVSDTGEGMPSSVKDRIFDPFFTTKKEDGGTGLGLSVVHGIIKGLNGQILVESEPGRGTSFDIYLPAVYADALEKVGEETFIPVGNEHILLVDDERTLVDVNTHFLESLGYMVTGVTGPMEALEAFRARPNEFDLVITDMTMPQMTGDALAQTLLKLRPDLPVIMYSGFSSTIDADRMAEIGIRALLHKPLLKREIAETIRRTLDGSRRPSVK